MFNLLWIICYIDIGLVAIGEVKLKGESNWHPSHQKNILLKNPALLGLKHVNSFHPSVALHIKTSRLICIANQMTGFYMKCNAVLKWLKTRIFFERSITFLLVVEIRTEEYWKNVALKMISNYLELPGVIRHLFLQKAIS